MRYIAIQLMGETWGLWDTVERCVVLVNEATPRPVRFPNRTSATMAAVNRSADATRAALARAEYLARRSMEAMSA